MVSITVLKRAVFEDIINEYSENSHERCPCSVFKEGQKFIIEDMDKIPDGFCTWAWADIQRDVAMINFGATPTPKQKNPHSMVSCCTDGSHPVIFRIEKIQE